MKKLTRQSYCKLDAQCLRAGDVILFKSRGLNGLTIRIATANGSGNSFSHAALLLETAVIISDSDLLEADMPPTSFVYQLFEADGFGVGFTGLNTITTYRSQKLWVVFPVSCKDLAVYRHPALEQLPPDIIRQELEGLTTHYHADPYSLLERLIEPVKLPSRTKKAIQQVIKKLTSRPGYLQETGIFCSELVAAFFDQIKLPLFNQSMPAASVSPTKLAASNLVRVQCKAEPLTAHERSLLTNVLQDYRAYTLPALVQLKTTVGQVQHLEDETRNAVLDQFRRQVEQLENSLETEICRVDDKGEQSEYYTWFAVLEASLPYITDPGQWKQTSTDRFFREQAAYKQDLQQLQRLVATHKLNAFNWLLHRSPELVQNYRIIMDASYALMQLQQLQSVRRQWIRRKMHGHPAAAEISEVARDMVKLNFSLSRQVMRARALIREMEVV